MGRTKPEATPTKRRRQRPATTPEARENQLISLAYDLIEQRLLDGTATSQETTSLVKLGSLKARMEVEKLRNENELLKAKTEALESTKRIEELYSEALSAMRTYGGYSQSLDE